MNEHDKKNIESKLNEGVEEDFSVVSSYEGSDGGTKLIRDSVDFEAEGLEDCLDSEQLRNEGNVFFGKGEFEEAALCYRKATMADGDKSVIALAHSNLAITLSKLSKHDQAILECEQALSIDPSLIKPKITKTRCLGELKRYDEQEQGCLRSNERANQQSKLSLHRERPYEHSRD